MLEKLLNNTAFLLLCIVISSLLLLWFLYLMAHNASLDTIIPSVGLIALIAQLLLWYFKDKQ